MKKIVILMCTIGVMSSSSLYANNVCQDKFGNMKCGAGTVSGISYTGFVDADGTTVTNMVDVLGNMTASNTHLNVVRIRGESHLSKTEIAGEMQVTGKVNTNDVQIRSNAKVTGYFYASHTMLNGSANIIGMLDCEFCVFKSEVSIIGDVTTQSSEFVNLLTLNAKKSTFSDTKLNDIFVKKPSEQEDQTIYLKSGSRAHNITFESQRGIVTLSGNSQVTGYVKGGKVVKN